MKVIKVKAGLLGTENVKGYLFGVKVNLEIGGDLDWRRLVHKTGFLTAQSMSLALSSHRILTQSWKRCRTSMPLAQGIRLRSCRLWNDLHVSSMVSSDPSSQKSPASAVNGEMRARSIAEVKVGKPIPCWRQYFLAAKFVILVVVWLYKNTFVMSSL